MIQKLKYFFLHANKFISLLDMSKEISTSAEQVLLHQDLNIMSKNIDKIYNDYLEQQLIISFLFFYFMYSNYVFITKNIFKYFKNKK